jgi:hypothetical protein
MQFSFEIGDREKIRIEFSRGFWWGGVTITANGQLVASRSALDPSTQFNFDFVKRYEFIVGDKEEHKVAIEHKRPVIFGGIRRQTYRVIVDEHLLEEHYGY